MANLTYQFITAAQWTAVELFFYGCYRLIRGR